MRRSRNAILLVLIFLLPGCLNAMNDEEINEQELIIEVEDPPIPVISVSPSEPLTGEDVFVNVQIFNYMGGEHEYRILLDGLIVLNGTISDSSNLYLPIGHTAVGEHTIGIQIKNSGDITKFANWTFITHEPEKVTPVLSVSTWYDSEFDIHHINAAVEHPESENCSIVLTRMDGIILDDITGNFFYQTYTFTYSEILIFDVDCGSNQTYQETLTITVIDPNMIDTDEDGIPDIEDSCPNSDSGYTSNPQTDHDSDGCYDPREDSDDDEDGIADILDRCSKGEILWNSSSITDYDGDGCHDNNEDLDDDNDGVLDGEDACPYSTLPFVSSSFTDHDGDGCEDTMQDSDDDNDGYSDTLDSCPKGIVGWIATNFSDYDSDGCRDIDEDTDDDADNIPDVIDQCEYTTIGSLTVDLNGCDDDQRDSDADGFVDSQDECVNTPAPYIGQVNSVGCADIDGDGVYSNVDICPNSPQRWTIDTDGCALPQIPIQWSSGPNSASAFGTVGEFSFPTTTGSFSIRNEWTGNHTYLFIFNYKSSSYMTNLWSQDVGLFLAGVPDNTIVTFGSFDSDYASDIQGMENRVQNWLGNQDQTVRDSWNGRIQYMDQRASSSTGSLGQIINEWSAFYYGIDRFQRWRQVGSLLDWSQGSSCCYRLHYIAHEPQMWNSEFPTQLRPQDPGITTVDVWAGERHSGGWGGGYSSYMNATLPEAITMDLFDTLEVHHEHRCTDRRDRYGIDDDGDGSTDRFGGCHEWDRLQRLSLCNNTTSNSCGTEVVRYITTYGREGQWTTDISPFLFMFLDGGDRRFKYSGAEGGNLVITLMFSKWDNDDSRPVRGELAFVMNQNPDKFNSNYNNESAFDRRHDVDSNEWHSVSIVAAITGHGFGEDPNNCAEFCNHEHKYSMNGYDVTEDHPMAGNSSVNSDREGCRKTTGEGTVANQFGSWPYGRAGWCAGQDVKLWIYDISHWINPTGTNELLYQGLFDGAQYQETSTNPYIVGRVWIVYEHNTTNENSGSFNSVDSPIENRGMITADPEMSDYATFRA